MEKLHELFFELFPHNPILHIWPLVTKRMFPRKWFCSNVEVISETEVYFEVNDKSFYKKGIE